ncbi:MAG: hypothetical protein WAX66_01665 [Patescibacteria group bacterium]|jgi:AcrR family transcriptional regulator
MSGKFRVNEIASLLGVSQTTIYKRFAGMKERLKPHSHKEKGILLFDDAALAMFREAISTADTQAVQVSPDNVQDKRLASIESAMLAMAGQMKVMVDENRALREGMVRLVERLEPMPAPRAIEPPKPVRVWEPVRVQPVPMPWYERLWLQIFNPETLRESTE